MGKLRRLFSGSVRLLGDLRAIQTGTIGFRIARRVAGKTAKAGIRRLLRKNSKAV